MNPIPQAALDSPYLDTIISLVLVYALLSVLVSIMLEAWNKRIKHRGVFLQKVVYRLLDDPLNRNFGYLIYQHPIINKMRKDGNSYPHYIPAEGFANALIDTLADQALKFRYTRAEDGTYLLEQVVATVDGRSVVLTAGEDVPLELRLRAGVRTMADSEFKRLLTNFIDRNLRPYKPDPTKMEEVLRLDMDKLKVELGRWFDDYMDRASGEYKNDQRGKLRFLGLVVALVLNVDSLHLAKVFLLDKDLRDSMVIEAERVSDNYEEQKKQVALDTLSNDQLLHLMGARHIDTILSDTAKFRVAQLIADTQLTIYQHQAEQVLDLVRRWQLPLGWNPSEAPLSWFGGRHLKVVPTEFKPSQRAVLRHFQQRNTWSKMNVLKWLAGILVTTWALSFGAPFWFETLVKLINIRRSGPKPKTTDERKA